VVSPLLRLARSASSASSLPSTDVNNANNRLDILVFYRQFLLITYGLPGGILVIGEELVGNK
jgi:hypothetical protein